MHVQIINLPRAVPVQRMRPPQANIPQTKIERDRIGAIVRGYVQRYRLVPPMPIDELREHADRIVAAADLDVAHRDYIGVLVNNESWRDALATVPYERRLLLMPKCLRVEARCPAPFDEFGLLCKKCGLCSIQDLQEEAERLGYAVLVAEGSAIVTSIIQTGKIDAIVGVSCLSVLEKAFPHMEAAAIPGVAIPLLQDDCVDTSVDVDQVWEFIHLTSDDRTYRMDLDGIRREVDTWFAPEALDALLGPVSGDTARIARDWLAKAGKRWRPFLTACAYLALRDEAVADAGPMPMPESVRRAALAVECFHKASLIHDDIEDKDDSRYDEPTLHAIYGEAVAINIGDYLLGEGYRLLAELEAPAEARLEMLRAAAEGHRTLTEGQGAELCWARAPQPLSSIQVLDIFRRKTAPAFEVALRLGGALAGADEDVQRVFERYSEALGIAYQIRDDIDDLAGGGDLDARRPTLPLAVGLERAKAQDDAAYARLQRVWRRESDEGDAVDLRALLTTVGADDRCQRLLDSYKEEAIRSLAVLEHATLKGLLRRVVGRIFNDIELKGWCSEFEARNAAGRAVGADAAV
jgi:geranylgeranyl diphosphate synthase type II